MLGVELPDREVVGLGTLPSPFPPHSEYMQYCLCLVAT